MTPIVWLDAVSGDATPLIGSKLNRLAEMHRARWPVPAGFAVSTEAYRSFIQECDLYDAIDAEIAGVRDGENLAAHATRVAALFAAAPLPAALAAAITEAYDELCDRAAAISLPVAVRSSATGEDAAEASFAGQFETYLGLCGAHQVLDGVKRCWASLFTARALGYRAKQGLSHRDSPMAVGVLELINARAAGVGFSIHPVSGKRDRVVIEGS